MRFRHALSFAAVTAVLALATQADAAVNLIANGDFATPVQAGGHAFYYPGVDGWTSRYDGVEIGASNVYGLPAANPGGQNLELNANTWGLDRYTVTGLTVGETYILSWDYGGRVGGDPASATVSFGHKLLTTNSGSIGEWTHNSYTVVATAEAENIVLRAIRSGETPSYGNEFTNFSLVAASDAPEPATWAMLGLGIVCMALAYRTHRPAISIV